MTTEPIIYNPPSTQPPMYYRLALQLAKPLYRLKVWQRSRKSPIYKKEVNERFGRQYPVRPNYPAVIWCHAVSLGETNTIAPMIDELLNQGYGLWMTNTTQTGYDRVAERFKKAIDKGRLTHSYVPVDTPKVVEHFLDDVKPCVALFVETELWPVMLAALNQRDIPSILVNGRLSASSFKNYQRFSAISQNLMNNISLVIAQDGDSAKRFRGLHLESKKIRVAESLKWSVQPTWRSRINQKQSVNNQTNGQENKHETNSTDVDGLKADIFQSNNNGKELTHKDTTRPIWVAASTHTGEEDIAIKAHQRLIQHPRFKDVLLILVPRHPERFDEVANLLVQSGLSTARRSQSELISEDKAVYLADTMGELMWWYELADVALVGGSLVNVGGHNPIEAASVATPIIMGAYTKTCQVLVDTLVNEDALIQVGLASSKPSSNRIVNTSSSDVELTHAEVTQPDSDTVISELVGALTQWLGEPKLATKAGQRGQMVVQQKQNAIFKQLNMIEPFLPEIKNNNMNDNL